MPQNKKYKLNEIDRIKKLIDELKSDISTIKEKQCSLHKFQSVKKKHRGNRLEVSTDSLESKKLTNSLGFAREGGSTSNGSSENVKGVINTGSSCDGGPSVSVVMSFQGARNQSVVLNLLVMVGLRKVKSWSSILDLLVMVGLLELCKVKSLV